MITNSIITNTIKEYLDTNKYEYLHLKGMSRINYISLNLGIVNSIRLWLFLMNINSNKHTIYSYFIIERWMPKYKHEIKIL